MLTLVDVGVELVRVGSLAGLVMDERLDVGTAAAGCFFGRPLDVG